MGKANQTRARRTGMTPSRHPSHATLTAPRDIRSDYLNGASMFGHVSSHDSSFITSVSASRCGLALLLGGVFTACDSDRIPTEPTGPKVSVCHVQGAVSTVTDIFLSELPAHKTHGDYVARLEVNPLNSPGDSIQFRRVTDALAVARAGRIARNEVERAGCRITIVVAAGTFRASTAESSDPLVERLPFVIDVPDITLKGALRMQVDAGGRATGVAEGGDVTTFAPSPALILKGTSSQTAVSEKIIIINGHPDGPKGHGAVIEGFAFQSGRAPADTSVGGQAIYTMRVRDLAVRGNRFEGGFTSSMDLNASSGAVERNHLSGRGGSSCDICLAGPGEYSVRDNRVLRGGNGGVLILPAVLIPSPPEVEPYTLPATALITAVVVNNEVRDYLRKPVGFGLRIGAVGVGASSVAGAAKATFTGNNLVGNTFGIIVEGAFLNATDATRRKGDIELTTSGNTFSQNCQNDVLVTLSGSQTGLGIASGPYLVNSTYTLSLGADIPWDRVWYAHAAGTGNTLTVNGQAIPNGTRRAYDATRICNP